MLYGFGAGSSSGVGMAVLGLALGLPALQLLASFLAALVIVAHLGKPIGVITKMDIINYLSGA